MRSKDETQQTSGGERPSLTEIKQFVRTMRRLGAESVQIRHQNDNEVYVRFQELDCPREHATSDEVSEEEWQRRHAWCERQDAKEDEEMWDVDEIPSPERPDPPVSSEDNMSEKFDEWFGNEPNPNATR